jgi:hypothetical protein
MTQEVLTQTRVVGASQARTVTAKIHGRWYPVDLLDVIEVKTTGGDVISKAVQVEVKRINGKQFKPFKGYLSKIYAGMESAVGSVPVDHIRVDGKQLEVK